MIDNSLLLFSPHMHTDPPSPHPPPPPLPSPSQVHVDNSDSSLKLSLHGRCNAASLKWTVCVDQRAG